MSDKRREIYEKLRPILEKKKIDGNDMTVIMQSLLEVSRYQGGWEPYIDFLAEKDKWEIPRELASFVATVFQPNLFHEHIKIWLEKGE